MSRYADTQYRRYTRLKSRALDIYRRAVAYKLSHERILELHRELYADPAWKRLTQAGRFAISELMGQAQSSLYETGQLVWRLGPETGPLPEDCDGWKATETGPGPLSVLCRQPGKLYGAHFWAGTDTPFSPYVSTNEPRS
jgi:hypothetical protein